MTAPFPPNTLLADALRALMPSKLTIWTSARGVVVSAHRPPGYCRMASVKKSANQPLAVVEAKPDAGTLLRAIAQAAANPAVDIEKMERLFAMQQKIVAQDAEAAKEMRLAIAKAACANGCDVPPAPPSLVICRACQDKITAKLELWAERGTK